MNSENKILKQYNLKTSIQKQAKNNNINLKKQNKKLK